MKPLPRERRGAAMLLALWVAAMAGAVTAVGLARTGVAVRAAENRIELVRMSWLAEGCVNQLVAGLDYHLMAAEDQSTVWNSLDRVEVHTDGCESDLEPSGLRIDVNTVAEEGLRNALASYGSVAADSIAGALMDWRDSDDQPEPFGAEGAWYYVRGLPMPRNGLFKAREEVSLVRGMERDSGLTALLGIESDRILLSRAPAPVIASIPGIPNAAVKELVAAQIETTYPELEAVLARLTPDDRSQVGRILPDLKRWTTSVPDSWLITARATGKLGLRSTVEVRVVRDGARLATVRRRSW